MYSGLTAMKKKSVAVVIISNGPGELTTWVNPVVDELNKINRSLCDEDKQDFTLRLVLVPCPNATGKEFLVANSWNKFELITKSKSFWKLLIKPHSFANWPKKGVVIFLGGDQFWSILLAKRLGYLNITYAEWVSRWPKWTNEIAAMNIKVKESNRFLNKKVNFSKTIFLPFNINSETYFKRILIRQCIILYCT